MNKLKEEFNGGGFAHKQIYRDGDIAIYRRSKGSTEHYEVIIIKVIPEREAFGKLFPKHEKYPHSEQWGTYGWTCHDLNAAMERIRKIRAQREEETAQNT